MDLLRDLAFGTRLGPFPLVARIGFLTHSLILAAAIMVSGKKWSKLRRRVPVNAHRWIGILAVLLATLHLVMGISAYV